MKRKGSKKKDSSQYYSWNLNRIIEETEALETELLIHESDRLFREFIQSQRTRPEDPDGEKTETE